MDKGCSDAVLEVFVKLYEKGYIYKGSRIINWCPVCQTSISDAEVEHEEQDGFSGTSITRSLARTAVLLRSQPPVRRLCLVILLLR